MRGVILSLTIAGLAGGPASAQTTLPPAAPPPSGQVHGEFVYARPHWDDFIWRAPMDILDCGKRAFKRKNLWSNAAIVVSTGLLIWKDQYLVSKAYELGDRLHITHSTDQKAYARIRVGGATLNLQGPFDSGSALYFIGDGWVDLGIATGFFSYGMSSRNNRALQTASQIAESVMASGAVVQVLKHVTGRESPFVATREGGRWRPFPNQVDYHKNVPHYDAYPSGHLTAGLATITVIAENYPEYRYIRPVGYSLMTLLCFQMMNNGVHWASDYPLAIAMGVGFGKMAVRKGRTLVTKTGMAGPIQWTPLRLKDGYGLQARMPFG